MEPSCSLSYSGASLQCRPSSFCSSGRGAADRRRPCASGCNPSYPSTPHHSQFSSNPKELSTNVIRFKLHFVIFEFYPSLCGSNTFKRGSYDAITGQSLNYASIPLCAPIPFHYPAPPCSCRGQIESTRREVGPSLEG